MEEIWKQIPGYEGVYEVSNIGGVKSIKRTTTKGGILKQKRRKDGWYLSVALHKHGKTNHFSVHTLVLLAFVGPRQSGHVCRHLNGICTDNRIENLEYGTVSQNTQDSIAHGTMPYGERHGSHKLKAEDVIYIRSDLSKKFKQQELADRFGVNQTLISRIRLRKCWKHI